MGQGLLLYEGEAFVLQYRQEIGEGNAVKFAAVAALAEPAALLGAKVQVAGKFGVVGAVMDGDGPMLFGGLAHELKRQFPAPNGGKIAKAGHVHVLPGVIVNVVGV